MQPRSFVIWAAITSRSWRATPGLGGLANGVMDRGDACPGHSHLGEFAIGFERDHAGRRQTLDARRQDGVKTDFEDPLGHFVDFADAVDRHHQASVAVSLDQRGGLLLIDLESIADRFLSVVGPAS